MALLCGWHEGGVVRDSRDIMAAAFVQAAAVVRVKVRGLVLDLMEDILSVCAQAGKVVRRLLQP